MKYKYFIIFAFLFCTQLSANIRNDQFFFNYTQFNTQADHSYELGFGAPPLQFGEDSRLINTFYVRQSRMEPRLKLSDYQFSPIYQSKISEKTNLMVRLFMATRNVGRSLKINGDSFFYGGMFLFTRPIGSSPHWRWSYGAVIPDRSNPMPAIPAIGASYFNLQTGTEAILAFPVSGIGFTLTPKWQTGFTTLFENFGYEQAGSDFIVQRRFISSVYLKHNPVDKLWINGRLGYTIMGRTILADDQFETKNTLNDDRGVFFQIGVSYRM